MIDVGALEDFGEGMPTIMRLNDREVAVIRWGEEVFAVRNVCPHQSESFAGGHVRRSLSGDRSPGDVGVSQGEPLLVCPVHTWTYNLRAGGRCAVDPRLRVRTYPTSVRSGRVFVGVDG